MTRDVILTRVTITATWHDDSLSRGNFLIFFLKNQKKKLKKKSIKNQ